MSRLILTFLFLAWSWPARAQDEPVTDDDLSQLEEAVSPPPAAPSSFNPDLSFILDVSAAAFSGTPEQTGAHDPQQSGFNFQQLEMSLGSAVDPFFRLDGNVVFSREGVEIEEIYATSLDLPYDLQVRAGQFLTRFGRLNPTHPHSWDFQDQPLVNGKFFSGEGNRGVGAEVSWLSPLPWYLETVASVTDASGGGTARSFYGDTDLGVQDPTDLQYTAALKQFFPLGEDWSLAWGLSGALGPNGTQRGNRTDIVGTDLYLKYRPVSTGDNVTIWALTLEALQRRRQIPDSTLSDAGGYASLFWRFHQNWGTALRYERVSGNPGDDLDPDWVGDRQRLSASLTFWPSEFSRVRLQGNLDAASWKPQPVLGLFLGFEALIGAHGAHKF